MRALYIFLIPVFCGCARKEDPSWAKTPANGTSGESTLGGAPLGVVRFASPPVLDGKLDDAVWSSAKPTAPFVQPGDGAEAKNHEVAAWAKLGYDDQKLYVGAVIFDRAPVSPFNRDDVDPHDWEKSSALELMIQPGDPTDNRDYYEIQVDVHGAVFDTHWDDYNVPQSGGQGAQHVFGHQDWSCAAERAVYVSDDRFYSLEVAIPWSAFVSAGRAAGRASVPPKPGDVWRVNLYSFRDGQSLALGWSPIRGQGNFHKSARFGKVRFE